MFFILERTISSEERIRRAEEIYNRRKIANGVRVAGDSVNRVETKKLSLFKKMFFQLVICAMIYVIFYLIKNGNYIFSQDVINKTKEFLSYDINFGQIQNKVSLFLNENKFWGENEEGATSNVNEVTVNSMTEENVENTNTAVNSNNEVDTSSKQDNKESDDNANKQENTNSVGGIGGAVTNEIIEDNDEEKSDTKKSQSELDIEYIKENYSFILPVTGTVTSRYGAREETEVVSANHAGIDIGANTGTPIYAAMDGTVTVSSEEGEYGKHIDIENGEGLTRYAHCSKLLVKEGQKVKQGDKIAEVGSTGNSTGPHLHFEIRRENRTVNPEKIIDFGN